MSSLKALLSAPATNALGEVTWDDKVTSSTWLKGGVAFSQSTYSSLYAKYGLLGQKPVVSWAGGFYQTNANPMRAIASSSTTVIAVGYGAQIITSSDGIFWTTRTSGSTQDFGGCTYGNGYFVAVAGASNIYTSTDAITWTRRSVAASSVLQSASYGNSIYVICGTGELVATSGDTVTWTARSTPLSNTTSFTGVTYGNGIFVMVGTPGGANGAIVTSTDGITWTVRSPSRTNQVLNSVVYGNNAYVIVGEASRIMTSTDAITWTTRSPASGVGVTTYYAVTYANGVYLLAGGVSNTGNIMAYSTDAITWSLRSVAPPISNIDSSYNIYGLGFFNGKFIYGGFGYDSGAKVNVSTIGYSNLYNYDPNTEFQTPSTSYIVTNSPSNIYVKGV